LGAIEGKDLTFHDDKELWAAALGGDDSLANAALDRLCLSLGAVAGDMALAQGANAVVIAGGVGLRLADYLPRSGFRDRFIAKGRFERRMDEMPVKLITHPQPGLFAPPPPCEGIRMNIDGIMRAAPVIPVLILEEEMDWAALAETFVAAGCPCSK